MNELLLMKDMNDTQKIIFQSELIKARKDRNVALLLTLFFGGLGAHHFYLGKTGLGVLYLIFFWTFIPLIVSFFELFFIMKRVDQYNLQKSQEIAAKIKMI